MTGLALFTAVPSPASVAFDWFEYSGHDASADSPLPPGAFRNPILPGFHPDPSICRAGDDFYLVNSTFCWWPGIPVFHSRDLVNWRQVGYVIERPSQARFDGLGLSRGVFAPAIEYHDGVFHVVTTLVDSGGNCLFTARDPAGPWSDPIFFPEVDGIDPSLFFDDTTGRAWLVNNGPPPEGRALYDGHRAIWLQEFDVASARLVGPRTVIVDGGVDIAKEPIWIEGPHLYRHNGWYYLLCAEGGTGEDHSAVIFRSRDVRGPYEPWSGNPILTQRDLPVPRPNPVTSTGHVDIIQLPNGDWWSVFLGCRPYDADARRYNTGRETFMLPVTWTDDGWPVILPAGQPVPFAVAAPSLARGQAEGPVALNGNFRSRDDFESAELAPIWNSPRGPAGEWLQLHRSRGTLNITPRPDRLEETGRPAFIARRQQHAGFSAKTVLTLSTDPTVEAGIAVVQNESHHYFLLARRRGNGAEIVVERANGAATVEVATAAIENMISEIGLRVDVDRDRCFFRFSTSPGSDGNGEWTTLSEDEDATIMSTLAAGGFIGSYVGLHARQASIR